MLIISFCARLFPAIPLRLCLVTTGTCQPFCRASILFWVSRFLGSPLYLASEDRGHLRSNVEDVCHTMLAEITCWQSHVFGILLWATAPISTIHVVTSKEDVRVWEQVDALGIPLSPRVRPARWLERQT